MCIVKKWIFIVHSKKVMTMTIKIIIIFKHDYKKDDLTEPVSMS